MRAAMVGVNDDTTIAASNLSRSSINSQAQLTTIPYELPVATYIPVLASI